MGRGAERLGPADIRAESIAWKVEQAKIRLGVLEPESGSLLLRWTVSVVRPRYELVARR